MKYQNLSPENEESSAELAQRVVKVNHRIVEIAYFITCQLTSKWSKSICQTKIYWPKIDIFLISQGKHSVVTH